MAIKWLRLKICCFLKIHYIFFICCPWFCRQIFKLAANLGPWHFLDDLEILGIISSSKWEDLISHSAVTKSKNFGTSPCASVINSPRIEHRFFSGQLCKKAFNWDESLIHSPTKTHRKIHTSDEMRGHSNLRYYKIRP